MTNNGGMYIAYATSFSSSSSQRNSQCFAIKLNLPDNFQRITQNMIQTVLKFIDRKKRHCSYSCLT